MENQFHDEAIGAFLQSIGDAVKQVREQRLSGMAPRRRYETLMQIDNLDKIVEHKEIEQRKSIEKDRLFSTLLDEQCAERPSIPSIAIDSPDTLFPEDAFTISEYDDGSFVVSVSFPDIGILDPECSTLEQIARSLKNDPWKQPKCSLPEDRSNMAYNNNREIPSISVQGVFRADIGITNGNIIQSSTNPELYQYDSVANLDRSKHYWTAKKFAHAFMKYRTLARSPDSRIHERSFRSYDIHPSIVTEQFIVFAKSVAGKWMQDHDIPSLYTAFRSEKHDRPYVRTTASSHEGVNAPFHSPISNPNREIESWVPALLISKHLEGQNTDQVFNRKDMQRFANLRNQQTHVFELVDREAV